VNTYQDPFLDWLTESVVIMVPRVVIILVAVLSVNLLLITIAFNLKGLQ
jgi:hypothetical protein